jgi:hypothetical protein
MLFLPNSQPFPMALFKSGDPEYDQYAGYTTEQLIQIVTDTDGFHNQGPSVETARRILLSRGLDYRTSEQKEADRQTEALARDMEWRGQQRPRVRLNRPASGGTGLKWWHWLWIVLILVRVISCLARNGH